MEVSCVHGVSLRAAALGFAPQECVPYTHFFCLYNCGTVLDLQPRVNTTNGSIRRQGDAVPRLLHKFSKAKELTLLKQHFVANPSPEFRISVEKFRLLPYRLSDNLLQTSRNARIFAPLKLPTHRSERLALVQDLTQKWAMSLPYRTIFACQFWL